MNAPFIVTEAISADYSLYFALLLGIGMGFFLERAGFGSSRKLCGQFYLYDMTVFKVMFTAIITAMSGIYICTLSGLLDLEQVSFVPTFIVPQVLGGLLLGVGFVIGGYCPGTSAVACSTGKVDGILYALGIFFGMFVYGELYSNVESFVNSTPMGKQTLYEYFNLPYGLTVVLVLAMAFGGFWGATILEKKFTHWKPKDL